MRRSKTFYNIFILILVLGLGLVAGFGSYIYLSTNRSVIDRMADGQQSLIMQIRTTLEQKIQTIEYAFNTYSTTRSFREVVDSPLTEQNFDTYRELNSQLSYISSMGLSGVQYTLVSLERNWSITNGSITHLTKEQRDEYYDRYVAGQSRGLIWLPTDNGIRFVQALPAFSKNKKAVALSDISLETLNRTLQTNEDTQVYILNKQGELLYAAQTREPSLTALQLGKVSERASGEPLTGRFSLKGESGGDVTVLYAKSSYNNWVYATVLDNRKVADALQATRTGLIVMGLVILLLIVAVAYLLAVHFTKPIRRIQRTLARGEEPAVKDEVDWILRSIDSIVTEKESLESLIRSEMPKLETQFMLNLLRNRTNREETDKGVARFGYRIDESTRFATMLIQLDNYGESQSSDKDVLLIAVNKLAQERIPASKRMLPILLNERTQATVLLFDKDMGESDIRKQIWQYAKAIIHSAREYLGVSVSAGISDTYDDLLDSKEASKKSLEALHQRLNLGKESILFFNDISTVISGPIYLHYPAELEARLFDAIRLGDEQQVSGSLYPLLADMMKHSRNPMDLEVSLIRFVNNLIQLEQLIGAEVLLTQDNSNLYHRLLDTRNPEEIERILVQEIILPMVRSVKEKTHQQFRTLADRIAGIVRAEYDQDLSLDLISERLHYSPSYLSSIFKREYGTTFSEYVMNYRLEVAKKWLVETDMTIKEIAERLRYQNPQNFIRSYRKKEHVTPGAYRKAMLER